MATQITSILNSVKNAVCPSEDDTYFDAELIMHINTVFSDLQRLGVGPEKGFSITDKSSEWDEFYTDPRLDTIQSYMFLRVRLLFDPPSSSFVLDSMQKQADKMEWMITVADDEIKAEG